MIHGGTSGPGSRANDAGARRRKRCLLAAAALAVVVILPHRTLPGPPEGGSPRGDPGPARTGVGGAERGPAGAVRRLIAEHRYSEAVDRARDLLADVESARGPDSIETAEALDVLVAALRPRRITGYEERRRLAERALRIRESRLGPDHPEVVRSLGLLAGVHEGGLDEAEARGLLERCIETRDRWGRADPAGLAQNLNSLARILVRQGSVEEALALYERAQDVLKDLPDGGARQIRAAWMGLAEVRAEQGDLPEAKRLLERALESSVKGLGPRHTETGKTLHDLSIVLERIGDLKGAVRLSGEALDSHEAGWGRDHPWILKALMNHARHLQLTGDREGARQLYLRGLRIREGNEDVAPAEASFLLEGLARVDWADGRNDAALSGALASAGIARDHFRYVVRGLAEREALLRRFVRPSATHLAVSVLSKGAEADSSGEAVRRVWDEVVRSRALVLDEMASRHRAVLDSHEPALSRLVEELRSARIRFARLLVSRLDGDLDEAAGDDLIAARSRLERAERTLAAASLPMRRQLDLGRAGFEEVQGALPVGGALVAYLRYDLLDRDPLKAALPSYAALILPPGGGPPLFRPLGPAGRIEQLVESWRTSVSTDPRSDAPPAAEERHRETGWTLRHAVWDSIAPSVRDARILFVVPDGALHLINLAALPAESGRYLLEEAPLLHHLSTERDLLDDREPGKATGRLLAVGAPDFGPLAGEGRKHFDPLPDRRNGPRLPKFHRLNGAAAEVEEIAALWEAHPTRGASSGRVVVKLTGGMADEASVKRQAPGAEYIHIATHAFFSGPESAAEESGLRHAARALRLTGLALAGANVGASPPSRNAGEDGILTAEEIASLDLSGTRWTVLSACGTGVGMILPGEGVLGLRRAFEIAGVRTLVMSLWTVDDSAARLWMRALYEGRGSGLGTAEAVKEASRRFLEDRRARGATTHPFFWGTFVASGEWR